ncbi:MAG TPA: nuclease-related domain-containing protein [Steroidobacteraceae bacterium]|nr:nuclease-related domain-containing protein [Steroidobacteraceae bacterium]
MTIPESPAWWIGAVAAVLALAAAGTMLLRRHRRRARRRALLARLERIAVEAVHRVQVPDGMGGTIHVDHLLLTPRGVLILDTRRVPGLIFGGDQMNEWTVMARGTRYTFDNPQPALYDRIAAVKAIVGEVPVEGLVVFSNVGRFAKGVPKCVTMLDGLDLECAASEPAGEQSAQFAGYRAAWSTLVAQLRQSPHDITNL